MTDVLVKKKDIDLSEFFKNQREPKSKSERRLYSDIIGSYHQTLSNGWVEDAKQHRH